MAILTLNSEKELRCQLERVTFEGEHCAERITLELPAEIAGKPLDACVVTLCLENQNGADMIALGERLVAHGEGYTAQVPLSAQHTACAGALEVWIEARAEEFLAKTNRVTFRIRPHKGAEEALPEAQVSAFGEWVVQGMEMLSELRERMEKTRDAYESAVIAQESASRALESANTACAAAESAYLVAEKLLVPEDLVEAGHLAAKTVLEHAGSDSFSLAFFSDFHDGAAPCVREDTPIGTVTYGYDFTAVAKALYAKNQAEGTPQNIHLKGNPLFCENYEGAALAPESAPWCFTDAGTYSAYLQNNPERGILIFSAKNQLGTPVSGDRHVVIKLQVAETGYYRASFSYHTHARTAGANLYFAPASVTSTAVAQDKYFVLSASNKNRPTGSEFRVETVESERVLHLESGEYYLVIQKTNDAVGEFRYLYLDAFRLHRVDPNDVVVGTEIQAAGHALKALSEHCPPDAVVLGGDYAAGDWYTTKETTKDAFLRVAKALDADIYLLGECDDTPFRALENSIRPKEVSAYLLRRSAQKGAVFAGNGYGYLDCETQNVRIIFLHTDEKDEAARAERKNGAWNAYQNTGGMSTAQLNFLSDALFTAGERNIIVCSHRSLATFPAAVALISGFANRATGSVQGIGYDFSAASGTVWCCLHGHNHAEQSTTISGSTVKNIGCLHALSEDKGKNGGKTTAGTVITLDLSGKVIYADHIVWGNDRIFS